MPSFKVFDKAATITASTTWAFDPHDLSRARRLVIECWLTGNAAAGAGDKLDVYFQDRREANVYYDRAHIGDPTRTATFLGTDSAALLYRAVLSSDWVPLTASEEMQQPADDTLAVGAVINGPFAPRYRNPGVGTETAHQFDLKITDGGGPSFPIRIVVSADLEES